MGVHLGVKSAPNMLLQDHDQFQSQVKGGGSALLGQRSLLGTAVLMATDLDHLVVSGVLFCPYIAFDVFYSFFVLFPWFSLLFS